MKKPNRTVAVAVIAASTVLLVVPAARAQQPAPAAAAAPALDATLRRIEAARGTLEVLEAEFDQERVMGLFAQTLRAHGRLTVRRPASVRWEIVTPHPGVFTINGSTVSYSAGGSSAAANQNQIGPLGTVLGDLAAFLGGSLTSLSTRYTLTVANADHGAIVLTAQPREPNVARSVSLVRLRFGPDLRVIERIDIEEPGGDRSSIRIVSPHVNGRAVPLSAP